MFVQNGKTKQKNNKDIIGMPCIGGEDGNIKVCLEDKMEGKEKLLNEENNWCGELNVEKSEGSYEELSVKH